MIRERISKIQGAKRNFFEMLLDFVLHDESYKEAEADIAAAMGANSSGATGNSTITTAADEQAIISLKLNRFFTESFFHCPDRNFIQEFIGSDTKRAVYYYQFKSKISATEILSQFAQRATHNDLSRYLFGKPLVSKIYSPSERTLAESIMRKWINFIRTG